MHKHISITLVTLTLSLGVTVLGCDAGPDDEPSIDAEYEELVLASVDPEFMYPEILAEIDDPEAELERMHASSIAAPGEDQLPVEYHFLFPGELVWIPTCVNGTEICVENYGAGQSTYFFNFTSNDLDPNELECMIWHTGGLGGHIGNSNGSAGPVSVATMCPFGW